MASIEMTETKSGEQKLKLHLEISISSHARRKWDTFLKRLMISKATVMFNPEKDPVFAVLKQA